MYYEIRERKEKEGRITSEDKMKIRPTTKRKIGIENWSNTWKKVNEDWNISTPRNHGKVHEVKKDSCLCIIDGYILFQNNLSIKNDRLLKKY